MPLDEHLARVDDIITQLDAGSLSVIDFDVLRASLGQLREQMNCPASPKIGLNQLRSDYEGRIAGMVKAIAAVDRKRDRHAEALQVIEALPTLSVADLLEQYRLVAARFRDCFPIDGRQLRVRANLLRH